MPYVWIKFRTMHSSGPSRWEYEEVDFEDALTADENLSEALSSISDDRCTHSEHWRGVQGEIETPPVEYLENHKASLARRVEELIEAQARTQALIDGAQT